MRVISQPDRARDPTRKPTGHPTQQLIAQGRAVADICNVTEVSQPTDQRWRQLTRELPHDTNDPLSEGLDRPTGYDRIASATGRRRGSLPIPSHRRPRAGLPIGSHRTPGANAVTIAPFFRSRAETGSAGAGPGTGRRVPLCCRGCGATERHKAADAH